MNCVLIIGVFLLLIVVAITMVNISTRREVDRLRAMGCICKVTHLGPIVNPDCPVHSGWDNDAGSLS